MKLTNERHLPDGTEKLSPVPIQPPLGYKRVPSLSEQIRQQVLAAKLDELDNLMESEEEADDFAIDDDMAPFSPHENEGMPTIAELKRKAAEINAEIQRQNLEQLRAQLQAKHDNMAGREAASPPSDPSEPPAPEPASVK